MQVVLVCDRWVTFSVGLSMIRRFLLGVKVDQYSQTGKDH
jgi:hypothetical protein